MKETTRFYSSLVLLILLNAIIKPVWIFGIDRQVQNEVGHTEYGSYFAILNLSIVLSFLLDFGITNYYSRQLAANDKTLVNSAGRFVAVKLLFSLLYSLVIILIAFFSGIGRWDLVVGALLIQLLTSFFVFFRAIVTSHQWFVTDAWLSVLDKLLMIAVCGVFLYLPEFFGPINIDRFLVSQVSCTLLAITVTIIILLKRKFLFSTWSLLPGRRVFIVSLPYAVIILLMSLHARLDGFLLERISSPAEAGKYAAAYRLLDAANMIGYLFASFLLPFIAKNWSERKSVETAVLNVRHMLLMFAATIACIGTFMAPWIQQALYHQNDPDSVAILQWCIPSLIGYSLIQIYGTVMTATGHLGSFIYITLGSIFLNVLLNLILIPSLGAKGCCIASLGSQTLCGIATLWYTRQKLKIGIGLRSVVIYIFITATVCTFLYLTRNRQVSNWLLVAGSGSIVMAVLWSTKLINPLNWRTAVRH